MNTLIQKFLALFSGTAPEHPEAPESIPMPSGMPLASAEYLREFAHRLGLEVDGLSPAEQTELKARLDRSMDFREENYSFLYHEVYELGHGYSLADASRVSAQINEITAESTARAYLDYRENAVAAEALMAAGSLLDEEGETVAAGRLFKLADARRHRSSVLEFNVPDLPARDSFQDEAAATESEIPEVAAEAADGEQPATGVEKAGLAELMDTTVGAGKPTK